MAGEWFERAKASMLAYNDALRAETIDLEGTILHTECRAIEIVGQELEWMVAELDAAAYLDAATGEALSRWGADRYGVLRSGATASVVELTFSRATGPGAVTVTAGSVVKTADGTRFVLDAAVTLGAGVLTGTGTATSALAGVDQNVDAATITLWETAAPEAGLSVTNAAAAAGGNEAESDEQYRARVRALFVNARKGTLDAIRDGALAVGQVREAAPYEVLDDDGDQVGAVNLVIADEAGGSNGTLEAAVALSLDEYRGAGILVTVLGATVRQESIAVTITWAAGQATAANARAVAQAIVAFVNRLDPNGAATAALAPAASKLTVGLVEAAARTVAGVVDVSVTTPSGTVAPDNGEVIRTSLALVTVS